VIVELGGSGVGDGVGLRVPGKAKTYRGRQGMR